MFGAKEKGALSGAQSDTALLAEYMDRALAGDFSAIDTSQFHDRAVAEKYNQLLAGVMRLNNNVVMRLNDSMTLIGDSGSVKNMLDHVHSQSAAIDDMQGSSQELGTSIENIQNAVSTIQESTHSVMKDTEDCVKDMDVSIRTVDASASSVMQINSQIADFQEKAKQIIEIIDIVKKVAKKSGLLALNASIEAARAGEAGKGFAVVANQIKELSANTTESAERVMGYVDELLNGISALADSVNTTTTQLASSNERLHDSVTGITRMSEEFNQITTEIDRIYSEINTQSALTQSFIAAIDTIAANYEDLKDGCHSSGEQLFRISRLIDNLRQDLGRRHAALSTLDWMSLYTVDHLIFTWRLYNHLAGFETLKITQLNNPAGCKFGKWRASLTDRRILDSPEFQRASTYHDEIHRHGCDSWNAKENGDIRAALDAFELAYEAYGKFSAAMKELRRVVAATGDKRESEVFPL